MDFFNPAIQSHNQSISIRTTYRDASFYGKGLPWRTPLQVNGDSEKGAADESEFSVESSHQKKGRVSFRLTSGEVVRYSRLHTIRACVCE